MSLPSPGAADAVLLRIYLSESHRRGNDSLFERLIETMHAHGLRGATIMRGIAGFGNQGILTIETAVDAVWDPPMLIEVADDPDRIRAFLPHLETVLDDGLVTLERVTRFTPTSS